MSAIYYKITSTKVPNLVENFHNGVELGYAYETSDHYVHFYGHNKNFYAIQTGLTVIEKKSKSAYQNLSDWVTYYFGAKDINPITKPIGETIEGVWRPALYYTDDIQNGLNTTESDRRLAEQALKILLEKLDDLFLYIEPDINSLSTYSHKTRELLILACTEVENFWTHYMTISNTPPMSRNYTTKDYVKLKSKLFLGDFSFTLRSYSSLPSINPFKDWDENSPTTSLVWYDAYNKTKHDRTNNFFQATLLNTLTAVIANIVLYIVRFSPHPILEDNGTFNSIVNQHFKFELKNPTIETFYIPKIKIPDDYREDIFLLNSYRANIIQPYIIKPLII